MGSTEKSMHDVSGFAIIGYAARFPGAADAHAFWEALSQGRDGITEIPADRWDAEEFHDPDAAVPGKIVTRRAGLVDDVTGFDAPFFGISAREAGFVDPQHRLLMETAWHAVEHAGIAPTSLENTNTGVFVGLATHDYLGMASDELDYSDIEPYMAIGTAGAAGAGRISYGLGLQGPAVTVDTACSSSLVAIHQACQALRLGECDLALAGGANALLSPATMITFSRSRMLSPAGMCKTFDADADGYVRGEGCGVIVVKRLSDAIADGDRIRAVIRGSAINQDGASGGITVPNGVAQQRVITDALRSAGLAPAEIGYLEAHGTGTSLGDPIEAQAAGAALGAGREAADPLLIGSVKTNIGHLEAAAGVAGVLKVVLSLEHGLLPKNLHFHTPSPHIPWDRLPIRVVDEPTSWPRTGRPRIAGVSSFGFSGTNAHVILEEAPEPVGLLDPPPQASDGHANSRLNVLPLSARSPAALIALAAQYRDWLRTYPQASLADVCRTAGEARAHLEHRAALVADSREAAAELLDALVDDRPAAGLFRGFADDAPKTAWLFTGQGSQYAGMARGLYDTEPVFADVVNRCAEAVSEVLDRPLLDVIFDLGEGAEEVLRQTRHTQPALFALEMGLARLWQSRGLEPDVLLGHSVGQYAAACVAGVFSLEDGALLMAERGRLFDSLPEGGRMAAVFTDSDRVAAIPGEFPTLSVAARNGSSAVLSGPAADLDVVVARLTGEGVRCDWLETSHAFHSALLDPILDEFESYATRFEFRAPERLLVCNRTGATVGRSVRLDASYWRQHARQTVEFAAGVSTLAELGCKVLVEIGPQPLLAAAALRAWPDPAATPRVIASMRRTTNDRRQIAEALASAYVVGHLPHFAALRQPGARVIDLPGYAFQHRQYWFSEARNDPEHQLPQHNPAIPNATLRLLEDGRISELAALLDGPDADPQTVDVLTKLANHYALQRKNQSIADANYGIDWRRAELADPSDSEVPHNMWLIIGPEQASVTAVSAGLHARGQHHLIVDLPQSDTDEQRFADDLRAAVHADPALIVLYVAALDTPAASTTQALSWMQRHTMVGLRRLLRTASGAHLSSRIWVLTRAAQRICETDAVAPEQSCVWGFGRAAALEYPRLWGGLIDLDPSGDADWSQVRAMIAAASKASREDQIALRGDTAYVPRLVRRVLRPVAAPPVLRPAATYLVTGGLGAIGLEFARYLAANGARSLVLTSRSEPGEAVQHEIDAIVAHHHCRVRVITADVGDAEQVRRLISTVRAELPPLAGVVHAAGVMSNAVIGDLDDVEIDRVFAGKVWGAWYLSQEIADLELDFFLCTSSIASVWGSFGQTAYSAANAYLDGLASALRDRGVPGIAVNFGPWSAGMADEQARARLAQRGVQTLAPADALAGVTDLLAGVSADSRTGPVQAVVARIDWSRFLPLYQQAGVRGFLAEVQREIPAATNAVSGSLSGAAPTGKSRLVERLIATPVQRRKKILTDFLRDVVAEVTHIKVGEIRDEAGFFDLGMDSLMAIELRRRVEAEVGCELPVTLAMDYPRVADVADYLLVDVLRLAEQSTNSAVPEQLSATSEIDEAIAIVALSCRFPGAADPEAFWELLAGGVDAIREVPEDRFDIDEFYDPDPDAPGKTYSRYGGFIDGIDEFDPEFFGISPREAVWIDPQQRLVLEVVWEALERAGYAPAALRGSRTGVFVGVAANEYVNLLLAESVDVIESHFITGSAVNAIAGRVAFALGFEGPAIAIDTACSSSLVAIHQACQALRFRDCDLVVAGGVNALPGPLGTIAASRARMLSPVGRCKTFDASADGYVRSEGCGILVLKRLSDAVRDGDQVSAVIRGSAVNQDGASSGLTVPNGLAQQRLINTALSRAGLSGEDVDYLEAHGTGTPLGDPIEVQAAAAVYGVGREEHRPLLIGSVKSNIGHLESASGAAGLIKVVLSLQHAVLPESLHFDTPSPHIPWASLAVRVVDSPTPWTPDSRPRRAGVSSFGFTGTNAHLVLEEAPYLGADAEDGNTDPTTVGPPTAPTGIPLQPIEVLPLSARSPQALLDLAQRYRDWLTAHPDAEIADVCFTAGTGRSPFEYRAALVVDSVRGAAEMLEDLAADQTRPGLLRGECANHPTTAWLFTGQGSQYAGMARELFDTEPVFAETVSRCAQAVNGLLDQPLLDVMFGDGRDATGRPRDLLRHTSFAQPALFAVEMGLARLWQSWGIEPDVVLGHSVGQYAAACVAGVFGLDEGARLIAERGRLFGSLPDDGRMIAVFADPAYAEELASEFPRVSVAAYNGPNTVLSGPATDLDQILTLCSSEGIRCSRLETSHAFHSELLDPILDDFQARAARVSYAEATVPLVCNRTGAVLAADTVLDARYWRRHSRDPVQFAEGVRTIAELGCSVLMEIGPQPVLAGAAVQVWPEHLPTPRAIVSLRKGVSDRRQISEALAGAFVSGHRPNFAARYRGAARRMQLPTYPFQHRSFWPKNAASAFDGTPAVAGIMCSVKELASGDSVYTTKLSVKTQPWLAHHVIYGSVVVPGATYAAMALAAVGPPARVENVFFYEPIILPEKASREVQVTLKPLDAGPRGGTGWAFQVHSREHGVAGAHWSLNADGTLLSGEFDPEPFGGPDYVAEANVPESIDGVDSIIARMNQVQPMNLFEVFDNMELSWGPTWSGSLKALWLSDGEAFGDVVVGDLLAEHIGSEPAHPVLLDLCTGVAFPAFPALMAAEQDMVELFLPLRYGQVFLHDTLPRRFYCHARWRPGALDSETQIFDIDFLDLDGRIVGGMREFTVKRAPREALLRGLGGDASRLLYHLGWHEVAADSAPTESAAELAGNWLIVGFDTLAESLNGCLSHDIGQAGTLLGEVLAEAADNDKPFTGIVWRSAASGCEESVAEAVQRLESSVADLLSAVHTLQAGGAPELRGGLWIITEGAVATESCERVDSVQAALWGLGRTIVNEEPALHCRLVDCDGSTEAIGSLAELMRSAASGPQESELAMRQGKLLVPRLVQWARSGQLSIPRTGDYVLAPTERGAIDNLAVAQTEAELPPLGCVQVRVEAAGLNFRDVLNVLGLYPGDPGPIGGDFAGVVTQLGEGVTGLEVGQRVYGFMQGAFASRFALPAQLLAPIPDGISAVEAATIPAAALTTRLAFDWAELKPGERVLIHAASGGVGLAAIQMAQQCGAIVFATASTYKRQLLRDLGVQYVYDSRTLDFADQILADTGGTGVDVVLNSLTNDGFIEATVRATARHGRFVEIAKRDIWTTERMAEVRPDINYEIVALDTTTLHRPDHIRGLLGEVSAGLATGQWRALPAEIYPLTEAKTAFRRMQQARHIGKIVLQMPNPLQPRSDRTYLITGGLGAIGLHTASYFAQAGAGDIVLTSRREPDAAVRAEIDAIVERHKCRVHLWAADVGDESQVAALLDRIRAELPPLGGVVHLAGVLDDAMLARQDGDRFRTTLAPKACAALYLDRLTQSDDLEFFIVSSSVSSLLGSPGQANYSTANALLDGLVADRRAHGRPATGINFGPWGRGGMASSAAARANIGVQGLVPLEPSAALGAMAEAVADGAVQAAVIKANWQRMAQVLGTARPPILDLVLPSAATEIAGDSELLRRLQETPTAQRADFITEFLQREVQGFLRLAQPPAAGSRFLDLGTDSLMAVELRNRLHTQLGGGFTINATAVFDYPTIRSLAEYLADQLPETG